MMVAVGKLIIVFMLFLLAIVSCILIYQFHKIIEEDRAFKAWMKEFHENECR